MILAYIIPTFDEIELIRSFLPSCWYLRWPRLSKHSQWINTLYVSFDFRWFERFNSDIYRCFGQRLHLLDEIILIQLLRAWHLEVRFVGLHNISFGTDCWLGSDQWFVEPAGRGHADVWLDFEDVFVEFFVVFFGFVGFGGWGFGAGGGWIFFDFMSFVW